MVCDAENHELSVQGSELTGRTGTVLSAICMPGGAVIAAGEDDLIRAFREVSGAGGALAVSAILVADRSAQPTAHLCTAGLMFGSSCSTILSSCRCPFS